MALIIKDRVKEITTTTGTGAVSLGGASATFDAFQSVMSNGDTTFYAIVHTASGTDEWEVGLGTWNTGNTLTRTTVYAGSNGTSAVNFSSGNKDIFMTYPASKAAVAGEDVTFVDVTATNITATGTVTLAGDPTSALQAATKEYVDTIAAAGIHYHTPVRVEAPSALTATYDNGTSGVGATLTNSGTQAALVIDGVTLSTSDRVLVYNQTNAAHNGVYTVTNTGSASTNWVLTRATDADSYGASDPDALGEGDAYFVKEGDTGAGELYVMNTSGVITFGTTNITFTVIAETAVYSAGTGLTLTGTTFSTNQDISTSASPTFNNITVTGTVDGRDVATDGSKLDGIEAGATADQTAAEIKTAYESNSNTNAFTDAEQTKLSGIETGATADQTASEILTAIKTVDGSASGLDADLLDGQQGSYYLNTGTTFSGDVSGTYNNIVVANDSHTHDGRYYTETEADSRFVNVTGDTMTGGLTISSGSDLVLSTSGTDIGDIVWSDSSGEKHRLWDGGTGLNYRYRAGTSYLVFHDGYHPNADKWTTARTLSLSGDASGSVSWDGSANATLSVTVANDSHTHTNTTLDMHFGRETQNIDSYDSDSYWATSKGTGGQGSYPSNYVNVYNFAGNGSSEGTQLATYYGSNNRTWIRSRNDNNNSWLGWSEVWTSTTDGSGSGLDADLLDGIQGSSFLRSDAADTASGDITFTGGAGAISVGAGSDLRFTTGNWTGEYTGKIQYHSGHFYFQSADQWILRNSSAVNVMYGDQSGNWTAVASLRSPIFYDTNDTSRYIDPKGDSYAGDYYNVDGWFRNYGQRGLYNQDTNSHFFSAGSNYWHINSGNTTSGGLIFYKYYNSTQGNSTNRYGYVYWDSSGFGLLSADGSWAVQTDNSKTQIHHRLDTPIMYDQDNTGYYVDPASTSLLNALEFGDSAGPTLSQERDQNLKLQGGSGGDVGITGYGGDGSWDFQLYGSGGQQGFLRSNWGSWSAYADTSGNWTGTASVRAPIFYDSNNTSYYVNPAAGGTSVAANLSGRVLIDGAANDNGQLLYVNNTHSSGGVYFPAASFINSRGNHSYGIVSEFRINTSGDSDRPSILFYGEQAAKSWQVGMGSSSWMGTDNFGIGYRSSNDPTTFSTWPSATWYMDVSGNVYAASSYRAPIYYDSNNTGYYVDPAGTSRMNRVNAGYDPGTDNSVGCSNWFRSSGSTGWYNASYGGGIYMIDSTWVRVYNGKSFYQASGTLRCDGDIRAPIFYDQNDTAYYTNPAGESSISSALVGSHIKFGDSTYSGGRIDWNYNSNNMRLSRVTGISFDWGTGAGNSDAHSYHGIASINDSGSSAGDMRISSRGDIHFRIDTDANSTNNYIKFFNNYVSGTTTQMGYWGGGTTTGQLNVYGTISCAIYYDRNDTAYYVDPNSASHMHTLHLQGPVYSRGDSNTRHEFHAADQWRVVVGGSERLEVKNSSPHVLVTGDLNSTSDKRLKENVAPITNALADVTQLEGVSFDWKDTGTRGHGFIAQQVEPILPDVVSTDEETGMKSINYVGMIGHLVEAIKELKAEIEELKGQ